VHAEILHEVLQCVDGRTAEDNVESVIVSLDAEEEDAMATDVEQIDTNDETLARCRCRADVVLLPLSEHYSGRAGLQYDTQR
jgi:hypothetical protein